VKNATLARRFKMGRLPVAAAMQALVRSFPTLRDYPHTDWDPKRFQAWAIAPARCEAARHAARFILTLWNTEVVWRIGRFDAVRAMGTWDGLHRAAFHSWVKDPWWP
jgi:hypothetical protein